MLISGINDLIDSDNDMFLTFNYTSTLQDLYNVVDVCHIHGKQGSKIYFGHGNSEDYTESYMSNHTGSENNLSELDDALRKNTKEALSSNKHFFERIDKSIEHIYSYGFSYSDVDLIYIKEVIKRLNSENAIWHLYKRNSEVKTIEGLREYKNILKKCGFKGEVKSFSFKHVITLERIG